MSYAFAVNFSQIEKWDVLSASLQRRFHPVYPLIELSQIVSVRFSPVQQSEIDSGKVSMLERVSFDGEIFSGKENSKMQQFLAKPGDIIVSKIRARQGSVGLVASKDGNVSVTIHYRVLTSEENLDPTYAWLVLRSKYGRTQFLAATGGAMKGEISEEELLKMKIPLPPVDVQHAIVSYWKNIQKSILRTEEKISTLENVVEEEVLSKSRVAVRLLTRKAKYYAIQFADLERWGVEFNSWQWDLDNLIASDKFESRKLSEIAEINPAVELQLKANDNVTFVPMSAVSDEKGEVIEPELQPYSKVKSGYTRFAEDDIIWAKITPCMENGKSAIAHGLENSVGFGSTEFHVVRLKPEVKVLKEFVWILLRLKRVREAAKRYFIGSAGQQRVPAEFLENLKIPIPPLEVQIALVEKIKSTRAEIARQKELAEKTRQESESKVEALILGTKKI